MPPSSDLAAPEPIPLRSELLRKALHLIALVVPLGMGWLGTGWALAVLVPSAVLAVVADVLRTRSAGFAAFIHRVFGVMMRAEEVPPVGGPVRVNGATWVLVTAAFLTFVFPLRIAVPIFAMFMVSDAAAAIVGRTLGRHHWPGSRRTLEGSAAFVVVGVVLLWSFAAIAMWVAGVAAVVGALVEHRPGPFNDNFIVPVVAAGTVAGLEGLVLHLPITLFPIL